MFEEPEIWSEELSRITVFNTVGLCGESGKCDEIANNVTKIYCNKIAFIKRSYWLYFILCITGPKY